MEGHLKLRFTVPLKVSIAKRILLMWLVQKDLVNVTGQKDLVNVTGQKYLVNVTGPKVPC